MDKELKLAAQSYSDGYTCSQAVFSAYAEDMGIDSHTACRLMEGFGGGIGGMQEVCGALAAAAAIISYYYSDGTPESKERRQEIYRQIQKAADVFQKEYGGITCKDILQGERPKPFACGMKVKDTVLIIEQIKKEMRCQREAN